MTKSHWKNEPARESPQLSVSLTISCPSCGRAVAPHAALCSACGVLLGRSDQGSLIVRGRAPSIERGRRPCPRCGTAVLLSEDQCGNCGRRLLNAYRTAARAILLVVVLLCGVVFANHVVRRWQGESADHHDKRDEAMSPQRAHRATAAARAARESFVAQLTQEYDKQGAGIALTLGGDELSEITFTSPKFTSAYADKLMENQEAMQTLRGLGFRHVWFIDGAGGRWTLNNLSATPPPDIN
ncbi:MAG: zinc ribbon domain-containing protein [Pyrinomonadaceae bacterium]